MRRGIIWIDKYYYSKKGIKDQSLEKYDLELQAFIYGEMENLQLTEELKLGEQENQRIEVIVKYHGNIKEKVNRYNALFEELLFGYGILTCRIVDLGEIAALEEIEYVEKPKGFTYENTSIKGLLQQEYDVACLSRVMNQGKHTGKGVLVAVIDSGCNLYLEEFRKKDGNTRIIGYWDLTNENKDFAPPKDYLKGSYYSQSQINELLKETKKQIFDKTGHGTSVCSIAVGNTVGIAREADLLVIEIEEVDFFGATTDIMRGITFCYQLAEERNQPLVVNLSIGYPYGSHRGDSLLERYLNQISDLGKSMICVGAGNEGSSNGHYSGRFLREKTQEIEFAVGEYERSLLIEGYFGFTDIKKITLMAPNGDEAILLDERMVHGRIQTSDVFLFRGLRTPYSGNTEFLLQIMPRNTYITAGVWKIIVETKEIKDENYDFYMPSNGVKRQDTGFYRSTPDGTITIPATSDRVISVGALDRYAERYLSFSGRGFLESQAGAYLNKPDLAATGDNVIAIDNFGEHVFKTGTSFSTPIVSGTAALLMEWGIVMKNESYIYGQNGKRYLCVNAKSILGNSSYPNNMVGWGGLCIGKILE